MSAPSIKRLFIDLMVKNKSLQKQLNELHERWHDYCFKDEFVCDLISEKNIRLEIEQRQTWKAIQQCRETLSREDIESFKEELKEALAG